MRQVSLVLISMHIHVSLAFCVQVLLFVFLIYLHWF